MAANKPVADKTADLIQERAAGTQIPEVFGSSDDLEQTGYESLLPSYSKAIPPTEPPTIKIGGPQCKHPYNASVYNCSALSFGPMSKNFILALNQAAYQCGFYQNTGEAGISPYHFGVDVDIEDENFNVDDFFRQLSEQDREAPLPAGDVVWQIGTGYFSCRNEDGSFDPVSFALKARISNVKMIELKLSQGVEPRKEMPVKQLTPGIAKVMGIHHDKEAKLQSQHSHFSTPIELMHFIRELRELSGGKPVGLKLGLTHRYWFLALCKAMRQTGIMPDFITVDGMEAGTAAASKSASGYTGTPLNEAIVFVHNALVGTDLREHIRVIASGRVFTERDVIAKLARGADLCATARAMLLAAGCDQQLECYLGNCRKGIATQDPVLMANFNTQENTERMINFHRITVQELNELLAIAGLEHPSELGPGYVQRRISPFESKSLDELYEFILPGALLSPFPWMIPNAFRHHWHLAHADAPFSSHPKDLSLRR
ncbi:MAG TPA: FMN-binding glutamate synthase family protein [Coleofasciculaceae cyanobacterium]|jgi:glutamate synthase domain-containing protein 2